MMIPHLLLLVDHMNIDFAQYDFITILNTWLRNTISSIQLPKICDLKIRAYGGWNENGVESQLRFEASKFYQTHCPALYRINEYFFRSSFEFAETLIYHRYISSSSDAFFLQNTVVKRHTPEKLISNNQICGDSSCELSKVKKWLKKKKACTSPTCSLKFSDIFYRQEQKQVDIHLALDFSSAIRNMTACRSICVVSNDLDLAPALISSTFENPTDKHICIFRTKSTPQYCDDYLKQKKISILNFPGENKYVSTP